jgi:hypothetical protein
MNEIWKDIPQYEAMYQVSNLGNVKSLKCNKEKFLKHNSLAKGYKRVGLFKNNKLKYFYIHQLVAMAFLNHKPCGFKLVVDHINDNCLDNRVENLQIISQRENVYKTQNKYSSNFKGVHWDKKSKKWRSQININGKIKSLGFFINELEAHLAYKNALKTVL